MLTRILIIIGALGSIQARAQTGFPMILEMNRDGKIYSSKDPEQRKVIIDHNQKLKCGNQLIELMLKRLTPDKNPRIQLWFENLKNVNRQGRLILKQKTSANNENVEYALVFESTGEAPQPPSIVTQLKFSHIKGFTSCVALNNFNAAQYFQLDPTDFLLLKAEHVDRIQRDEKIRSEIEKMTGDPAPQAPASTR